MATLICFVGRDRNKVLSKMNETYVITYNVKSHAVDLRENLQSMFNALGEAYDAGHRDITVMNYETGLEVGLMKSLDVIKASYTDLTFRYSTTLPQACWAANKIVYKGPRKNVTEDSVEIKRLMFGNVLDGFGTNLLSENYD